MQRRKIFFVFLFIFIMLIFAWGCGGENALVQGENQGGSASFPVQLGEEKAAEKVNQEDRLPNQQEASGAVAEDGQSKLWVTRDFGRQTLLEKQVRLSGNSSVLAVLQENTRVMTDYDGGFVKGINGLSSDSGGLSGKRQDWFYYVNGILANAGARDYRLQNGDVVWWDYHRWGMGSFAPAVIGCYPEPFLHGYGGQPAATFILVPGSERGLAEELAHSLQAGGVGKITVLDLSSGFSPRMDGPTIVIGEWGQLEQLDFFKELNAACGKSGAFVHFTEDGCEFLDSQSRVASKIKGSVGAIVATGQGMGDQRPLWLVVGSDQQSLRQAVDVLVHNPAGIARMYGAGIVDGEIVALPLDH